MVNLILKLKTAISVHVFENYFAFFSRIYLKRWSPQIIVITGSVGKTNLLGLLKTQLKDQALYSDLANTKLGVIFHMFQIRGINSAFDRLRWPFIFLIVPFKAFFKKTPSQKIYCVEYDVYSPTSAHKFQSWLRPEICLWLTLSPAHLMNFDQLAQKKGVDAFSLMTQQYIKIANSCPYIFVPDDNKLIKKYLKDSPRQVYWVEDNLISYKVDLKGATFVFSKNKFVFNQPLPRALSVSLSLTQALMQHLKISINTDLSQWQPPPGRSTLLRGIKDCYLLDSTYNAQVESMMSILAMFKVMQTSLSKWLVCGDMIEQGRSTKEYHQKLAQWILDLRPDRVILIGPRIQKYTAPLLKNTFLTVDSFQRLNKDSLNFLTKEIDGSQIILFKGAGYLDILVGNLLKNKADKKLLKNPKRAERSV